MNYIMKDVNEMTIEELKEEVENLRKDVTVLNSENVMLDTALECNMIKFSDLTYEILEDLNNLMQKIREEARVEDM